MSSIATLEHEILNGVLPSIVGRCFGCRERLTVDAVADHILSCDGVAPNERMRFRDARMRFAANPKLAFEVVEEFVARGRWITFLGVLRSKEAVCKGG